ncbi:Cystathionine gamma-synthase [Smittium culicis]|uniref:Cystathionine gamma-synthase n=1 Tax=Smittium culicis TaxID=133412 RepID=A0A1R1YM05_9FUNG|nr:Cystathionine gamma-synthase [Smittium culicis]
MPEIPFGYPIPEYSSYGTSVSLPKWQDNINYEEGVPSVIAAMKSGYPRFFIALNIRKLTEIIKADLKTNSQILIFPSLKCAIRCKKFVLDQCTKDADIHVREYLIKAPKNDGAAVGAAFESKLACPTMLYLAVYDAKLDKAARRYWQHTGDGISSRQAEYCLQLIEVSKQAESGRSGAEHVAVGSSGVGGGTVSSGSVKTPSYYKRPAVLANRGGASAQAGGLPASSASATGDELEETESLRFIEERYGRNLNSRLAEESKLILKKRISGIIVESGSDNASGRDQTEQYVSRGVLNLTESDVFLTPTGMSSIFHTHRTILDFLKFEKSICFGFPYTDTLKILSSFGPGSHFFGLGEGTDYDDLEALLSSGNEHIAALFTETPSNPLLKTPDLQRLRKLADKYKFALVVDDSIGNFVNLDTLNLADVVVSSLTKLFSGDSNVMGGRLLVYFANYVLSFLIRTDSTTSSLKAGLCIISKTCCGGKTLYFWKETPERFWKELFR